MMVCKCHGVSGSCTTRTCWHKLPPFRRVGDFIKRKFQNALFVESHNGALRMTSSATVVNDQSKAPNSATLRARRNDPLMPIRPTDLIFLAPTGDTCWQNGTSLVEGRRCIPARKKRATSPPEETRSCSVLCKSCGLRVVSSVVQVDEHCGCKFQWCCAVKCKRCSQPTEIFQCAT